MFLKGSRQNHLNYILYKETKFLQVCLLSFKKSYFVHVLNWPFVVNKILAGDDIFVFA